MKGTDNQPFHEFSVNQCFNPLGHFPGCFVGKRQRHNTFGIVATSIDQVGDFLRDHTCFATARARQDQTGPVQVQNGLTLGGIQAIKICCTHISRGSTSVK